MVVHSFHLATINPAATLRAMATPPTGESADGLHHAECMWTMELGAPVVSPKRMQLHRFAMFSSWEDEAAIDRFLESDPLGRRLADGWHVRLDFLRRWGHISEFDGLPSSTEQPILDEPVVAVTLARLKLPQVPRFIKWGKPVERLVRDDPGTTLALAAARPNRTVSTFTVWESARQMTAMVHGHSDMAEPERHSLAMVERRRKDFHFEFTTLRFRARSEHGAWEGRTHIVPVDPASR